MREIVRRWLGVRDCLAPIAPPIATAPGVQDLRNTPALFVLLDDTHAWRERLVEELVIEDGDHITVSSSYQIRIQPEVFAGIGVDVETCSQVRLILPVTTKPKELLLGVDLEGPDGPASLLLKRQTGDLQRRYIDWISRIPLAPELNNLLYGFFTFSDATWKHLRTVHPAVDRDALMGRYLSDGTSLAITVEDVRRWSGELRPVERTLISALDEPLSEESLLKSLLLALPFVETRPTSISEVDRWIEELSEFVEQSPPIVRGLVAEYCVRWEFIIDVIVPIGEPCKVKLATRRPWGSTHASKTTQRIVAGDAATVHVDIRVADHSVVIAERPELRDLRGVTVGSPVVDELRWGRDVASLYLANPERPYFLDLSLEFGLRPATRLLTSMLWALVAIALAGTILLPEGGGLADGLALLVFPLTLAGSVVLTRATTGVAQRLHERSRRWLTLSIGLVWLISIGRLVAEDIDVGWLLDTWIELRNYVSG